ncbi:TraB/GumN family protein [Gammaproteobacteria bacterium]|nr:TraB/GumN family protein [Gammaproteobacteria bacterium]
MKHLSAITLLFVNAITTLCFAQEEGPVLYLAESDNARVYILGGTDAKDMSWFTDKVESALNESDALWVEIPPANASLGIPPLRDDVVPSPSSEMHPTAIAEGYGNLQLGDYLDVAMGERSVVESQRLNLSGGNYSAMQPWLAYYTFYYAFWPRLELIDPELELINLARTSGKPVQSLFADRDEFFRFMGRMNDYAQTHFFQYLYNTLDWQRSGDYDSRFTWTTGSPDEQWLEKVRTQTPDYYRYMFQRRNPVIAEKVAEWLQSNETYFLYIDINRTLGPDSLQQELETLGISLTPK